MASSLLTFATLLFALCTLGLAQQTYDYIVVGSGAGGGPLACRLARAGHSTLLIEAGDDQGETFNYTVPGYQAVVTQDPEIRWDVYVNHYQDLARAQQDPKFVYRRRNGQTYTGLNPPAGAEPLGILYPRAGTLGGCVSHNALIFVTPHDSDWNYIAQITGDDTWSAANMRQYLDRVYEWQPVFPTDPTILARDPMLTQHIIAGARAAGVDAPVLDQLTGLGSLLLDPNNTPGRDSLEGFFQIPLIQTGGTRTSVRDFIVDTVNAGYPLTVQTDTHVTKINFDTSRRNSPRATGVQFLRGKHLYRASPLSGARGRPGSARARREVIMAGGTYNSVQTLKLSGIGPRNELRRFNIPVIKHLPGLGQNMQDRYEIPVNVKHPVDFPILDGCTFDAKPHDRCLDQWQNNPSLLALRGAYATDGLAATMAVNSAFADNSDIDLYIFAGPVNFIGYFPRWGDFAVRDHRHFSWYALKAHTRNTAGTVALRSRDPLDTPLINFNYFDTGTTAGGADEKDLNTLIQAVNRSREALGYYRDSLLLGGLAGNTDFVEERPGEEVQSDEEIGDFIKREAWGHHACCTAPIGGDDDPQSVLDSKFRVRGVRGLRVVDASVFPKIPGIFIQAPIFMVAEKAADVILNG